MAKRWINSADLVIDDATGALLVKVADAELVVDVAEVDVQALIAGIAGAKTIEDLDGRLATVEKAETPGSRTPVIISRANATPAADPSANGVKLDPTGTGLPYRTAVVMAVKGGANAFTPGESNAGTVYIATADSLAAAIPLVPGAAMELPPNCDLNNFYLIVTNADDAVQVAYTV